MEEYHELYEAAAFRAKKMLKVIIADDEILICRLVQNLVNWEMLDMEVSGTAENGLEALDLIEALEPDILITDIRMPGCDGLELIKRAKAVQPELEIVIISGYAHFEYAQSAIQYGVGNYLLKPIKQNELMKTLQMMKERCENRKKEKAGRLLPYQNSQKDLNRLRDSLIKDLISSSLPFLTKDILWETYHIRAEGQVFQAFLLKIDCDPELMRSPALETMQGRIKEIFHSSLAELCKEYLLYFQSYTGYGILNYDMAGQLEIRKMMRNSLNQLEAKKRLYGQVEFSLALGPVVKEPEKLMISINEARTAMMERLLEGPGRILEAIPRGVGVEKQNLLDRYVKKMGNAIENFDLEAVRAAPDLLECEAMAIQNISGKEIFELISAAGHFLISRAVIANPDEISQAFTVRCGQCCDVKSLFQALFKEQEKLLKEIEEAKKNEATRPIRMAKQYVMQHYQEPITLEEICEMTGFSVSYFSVLFKRETGEGFAKYLTRIRIEEAKTMLRETSLPIAEICEKAGYGDRRHFTQTFHKITGLNPVDYRKLYG